MMRVIAKLLGNLTLAVAGVWALIGAATLLTGRDAGSGLMSFFLAGLFAVPGALLRSYALAAERRQLAEALIKSRGRFSIQEVAEVLRVPPEHAHAFIAQQIAAHQLDLAFQQQHGGYARRGSLPAPPPPPPGPAPISAAPCASCGSTAPATETGFCPTCGARAEPGRSASVRA